MGSNLLFSEKSRFVPILLTNGPEGPRIRPETMVSHGAVPILLLAALLLPLPFFFYRFLFAVLLAVRPRGEQGGARAAAAVTAGAVLLRSPPH